jgi:hypothetical protein
MRQKFYSLVTLGAKDDNKRKKIGCSSRRQMPPPSHLFVVANLINTVFLCVHSAGRPDWPNFCPFGDF